MDVGSDFTFLADEKFDFDISLSPSSAKEETEDCDDEVFIGPVKHKEKCLSAAIHIHEFDKKTPPSDNAQAVWSPLSGDKFVEIFKEAHLLALQLECSANDDKKEEPPQTMPNPAVEKFVQESKSKLKLFDSFNGVNKTPVAIKRETYCIQDSPLHQLPPSIQQRIVEPNKKTEHTDTLRSQNKSPLKAPKVVKSVSVSPLTQKAKAPQGKSVVPPLSTGKIVSRLQPLKASTIQTKNNTLTVEKAKPAAKKLSPIGRKNLSSVGSTEDLLSCNSSIASDISDSSLNNSSVGQSKRTLPNKLNLGKAQFKTPSAAGSYRRNTSSSSSSHSSVNNSLNSSVSSPPAASGKLNTTLNNTISNSRLKPNTSRLALVRPLSGIGSTLKMAGSDSSNNRLKPNAPPKTNGTKPGSVSMAQPQTPAGKFLRQTSAPNLHRVQPPAKPESAIKVPPAKPQARIMPTPTSRLKLPQKSEGISPDRTARQSMKPTRLLSCGDIESGTVQSTPLLATKGLQMNSSLIGRSIPVTPISKHQSGLPTPVSRKTSGILTTPRSIQRTIPSLRPTPMLQTANKSKKLISGSADCDQTKPKLTQNPSSPTGETMNTEGICCSLNFSPENKPLLKQQVAELPHQAEMVLIDIGVEKVSSKQRKFSSIENDSQPLIDLSNTPELNKQPILLKPTHVSQLIDLSSPLIKLSPAANKENMDSPLLKF